NITPGAATHVAFSQQPTSTQAGATMTPAVTVRMLDANDNLTASTADVSLAIGTNPGSGTLSGTTTQTAGAGVATFNDLKINKTGSGYTLHATSTGVTDATSSTFDITPGVATHYIVTSNDYTPVVHTDVAISAQLADAFGNAVPTAGLHVTWSKT